MEGTELLLIPPTTYRLYRDNSTVTLLTIEGGLLESHYNPRNFVSKVFYTRDGAERALFGYRLLQGETLSLEERTTLVRLLLA